MATQVLSPTQALNRAIQDHVSSAMPKRLLKLPEFHLVDQAWIISYLQQTLAETLDEETLMNIIRSDIEMNDGPISDDSGSTLSHDPRFKIAHDHVIQYIVETQTAYAVLSHTWLQHEPEVTYRDTAVVDGLRVICPRTGTEGPGFLKLKEFCRVVWTNHQIQFAWMDTICINKDDNPEIDEAIRSMFQWYSNSWLCIVYLASTTSFADIESDRWFTRGWTLQELLTPRRVSFYTRDWNTLAIYDKTEQRASDLRKSEIGKVIEKVTGINSAELYGFLPGLGQGIASRMIWIANRQTTREEDRVYSIMGIFGVEFPVLYGEGKENAFFRLMEAIISKKNHLNTLAIFNYAGRSVADAINHSNVLPSGPECYLKYQVLLNQYTNVIPLKSLKLDQNGVKMRLLLVLATLDRSDPDIISREDQPFSFELSQNDEAKVWNPSKVSVRLFNNSQQDRARFVSSSCYAFGVWNFVDQDNEIHLPKFCSAFLFAFTLPARKVFVGIEGLTKDHISQRSKVDTQDVIILDRYPSHRIDGELRALKENLNIYGLSYLTTCL